MFQILNNIHISSFTKNVGHFNHKWHQYKNKTLNIPDFPKEKSIHNAPDSWPPPHSHWESMNPMSSTSTVVIAQLLWHIPLAASVPEGAMAGYD